MKRSECWLTFSEALEVYLDARDIIVVGGDDDYGTYAGAMLEAAEHMDVLTGE